jgi:hypothetical protein
MDGEMNCKHCGDRIKNDAMCNECGESLRVLSQCRGCHMELAHGKVVPDLVDVRDEKTSLVDSGPRIWRPTTGFDEPAAVHEGSAGKSLADGFAMIDGYQDARDRIDYNRRPRKNR